MKIGAKLGNDVVTIVDDATIPWVSTGQLAFLPNPFLYGVNDRGLQLHVSIGQAF